MDEKVKEIAEKCQNEIQEALKKYNCELGVRQEMIYGQPIQVPVILVKEDKK